ncbi:MAG: SusC/RagA family TonB-linked outer membrane protein, partial [Bacteroidota bacterium]
RLADEARLNRGLSEFDPNSILDNSRDPLAELSRNQIANTNWFDQVLRQGSVTDINLSSSRGGENLNYYISANYRSDNSILQGDHQERISLRANVDITPVKNFSIGTRVNLSWLDRERAPNGGAPGGNANLARGGYSFANTGILPILPIFHPTARNSAGEPVLFDPLSGRNPLATLDRNNFINDVTTYRALAGVQFDYKVPFIKGLSLRSELAADIIQTNNIEWGNTVIREESKYGFDFSSTFQRFNYNLFATYNRQFGELHNLNLVVGTESTEQATRSRNIEAQQLFGTAQEIGAPGDIQRVSAGFGGELFFRGYFGRLNYKYNDRYLLGLSYRRDGSSVFTQDLRWGDFLAVSGGWILSNESFLENNKVINFLKLRASYGQTGNSAISPVATATTYATWGRYGDVGAGDLLASIGNPDVTWETTDALDVGVDFELYEGRVNGSIGYYRQDVSDMLFQVPVPSSSGIFNSNPAIWSNIGDMRNQGIEIELNTVNIDRGDFQWRTGINFATNENEITRLVEDEEEIYNVRENALVSRVGDRIGFFRLARYAGIHPQGGYEMIEEMDLEHFEATGERRPTGNTIPATRANLQRHLFDNTDKSGLPTFFGGVTNSFSYKGLELFTLISFSGGNYIYDVAEQNATRVIGANNFRQDLVDNYWTPDNPNAEFPALSWNRRYDIINDDGSISENQRFDNQRAGQVHDRFLYKGDFIRLRSLGLSYNLPTSIAEKLSMQNIRIGFLANNLLTITGFDGYDPEVANIGGERADRNLQQGWVGVVLPQMRSYNFNINLTF